MHLEDAFIEIARVVKAHGLRGELKLQPFTQDPEGLRRYPTMYLQPPDGSKQIFQVERLRTTADYAIAKMQGLDDRDQAERCIGLSVFVHQDQIPPPPAGEFFIRDLIGLQVFDEQESFLGNLEEVYELPANDVYVVRNLEKELLIPAISEVILNIQLECRRLIVRLPEGLSD